MRYFLKKISGKCYRRFLFFLSRITNAIKVSVILRLLWSVFNDPIKFHEIDHQKYRIMQPLTCRTYHSWKSDSIRLESVEIACSFFLRIRLFPYSVDDFDSYSNKLCESSLERIRSSFDSNRFFDRYVGILEIPSIPWLLFNFGIKKISTIKKKFLRISISNSREFLKILIRC